MHNFFHWIQIPVWIVSWMVTVPILGTDLRPRDPNPNPSALVEMSHYVSTGTLYFWRSFPFISFPKLVHYGFNDIYKTNEFEHRNKKQHTLCRLEVFSLVVFYTCNTFALPSSSKWTTVDLPTREISVTRWISTIFIHTLLVMAYLPKCKNILKNS